MFLVRQSGMIKGFLCFCNTVLNIIGFPMHIYYVYADATPNATISCHNQSNSGYTIHILPAISNQLVPANLSTQCVVPSCSCVVFVCSILLWILLFYSVSVFANFLLGLCYFYFTLYLSERQNFWKWQILENVWLGRWYS